MKTREGIELVGRTSDEIVKELHKMSRSPCATDAEFRYQMAGRALTQTGKRVRCGSNENFIADLVEVGLLLEE